MNKFLLLATFLAMAASVSYAMPAEMMEDDDDDGMTALLQELETYNASQENVVAQKWFRGIAKKVCKFTHRICHKQQSKSDVANAEFCKYVKVARKVCGFFG